MLLFVFFVAGTDCTHTALDVDTAIDLYAAAQEKLEQGQVQEALKDLRVLGGKHPWFALAQWAIGEAAYKSNNYQVAYIGYKRYLNAEPAAPDRDQIKKRLGELEAAQPALKEYGDGEREARQSAWKAAALLLESSIKKKPGFGLAYRLLGRARLELGENPAAVAAYQKYLELDPDAPDKDEVLDLLEHSKGQK
jgi:outer membrane protein assembly factor BamD (BamD/ComL family)